ILERVSPIMSVVRSGAEAEPEIGELYRALHQGRRANLTLIMQSIVERGLFRNALSVEEATDCLWQLASPEMFTLLTGVSGYSTPRYGQWLSKILKDALLVH